MKIREDVHYAYEDDGTFVCLNCRRVFQSQYSPKQFQVKKYGTKQLLALWAWYNFERHLVSCWKKSTEVSDE